MSRRPNANITATAPVPRNGPAPTPRTHALSPPQSRRQSMYNGIGEGTTIQLHWLFRSNIPRRRGMPLPNDVRKRNFFGLGEIIGVLANPSETLRSLTESKKMLEDTRRELAEARERAQLTPTHTFSALPGFFERPAELRAIVRALEGEPSFTVLFGASSVGKTALLRQVLTQKNYHVLHFDLRIAGFADLGSLYMSLSQQMEGFFMGIARDQDMPGYEAFEKEAWGFKHDRLNVERRLSNAGQSTEALSSPLGEIKTSDIARLMELFQSSLLRYWNFLPSQEALKAKKDAESNSGKENKKQQQDRPSWTKRMFSVRRKQAEKAGRENGEARQKEGGKDKEKLEAPPKKIPVFFIDEAHKLPALIRSIDAMKCLLDAMLVLTKQDRLCHVIHATSDPFYQTWLRQLNVMQHCKIITIGDYPKAETRKFFRERILPSVHERLRPGLDFEKLYEAFGGKLAHWQDYITDYVNSNGKLDIKQSSHFIQAHALLNLHIIHSAQASTNGQVPEGNGAASPANEHASTHAIHRLSPPASGMLGGGSGFRIYSPLMANPHQSPPTLFPHGHGREWSGEDAPEFQADFSAYQLLRVMNRLAQPRTRSLPYFLLCREMGARAIDGMVKGRILDLRWTEPVSREFVDPFGRMSMRVRESVRVQLGRGAPGGDSSVTAINEPMEREPGAAGQTGMGMGTGTTEGLGAEGVYGSEEDMVPMTDEEVLRAHERLMDGAPLAGEEEEEVLGPKLVPISPIMRYAMQEVVQEYYADDDRTESEYASLADEDIQEY
ncbi:hypothetical protein DICSQDRAFT_59695 [Dichomitus squalens LYAD-421 SS1]|uniref:AAA+ ATPase domain-containing protein n=1 Tax=Dichomitus squalens (strain LYAD-421) TaxID=732165 RepID=R7T0G7_DICSQ|nr:uncharacterized protein DICSQDRAFT_59695 [Dichomitus squalens LYAD-421 SS1]EJF61846.1 hypothetical protein DICSQDRAFT_59695 [Dichomitus squalens LYAD-421 SS1]